MLGWESIGAGPEVHGWGGGEKGGKRTQFIEQSVSQGAKPLHMRLSSSSNRG